MAVVATRPRFPMGGRGQGSWAPLGRVCARPLAGTQGVAVIITVTVMVIIVTVVVIIVIVIVTVIVIVIVRVRVIRNSNRSNKSA